VDWKNGTKAEVMLFSKTGVFYHPTLSALGGFRLTKLLTHKDTEKQQRHAYKKSNYAKKDIF